MLSFVGSKLRLKFIKYSFPDAFNAIGTTTSVPGADVVETTLNVLVGSGVGIRGED